jgi:hypothetical protein
VIAKEKDFNGSMWSWDGISWHRMPLNDSLVFNTNMAYNAAEHQLVRFGGWNGRKRLQSTWTFRRSVWKKCETSNTPAARNHSIMVYDPENRECVLYGGHDGENVFGDIWSYRQGRWSQLSEAKPRKRLENGH